MQYSKLKLPSEFSFAWEGETHYLAHHDLVLLDGEIVVNHDQAVPGGDLRDTMTFVPAGLPFAGWARPADRLNAFTVLSFEPTVIEDEVQASVHQQDIPQRIYFREGILGATMKKLGQIMSTTDGQASQAYIEAVALTATLELGNVFRQQPARFPSSGELNNRQRILLVEYIEANIASDIGLDDMASVCGLTRFHFSRAFKSTFGEPPYRYLTRQRIDLAKRLLASGSLSVAEIATACGFNGAPQFARAFRELEHMSPTDFRRRML